MAYMPPSWRTNLCLCHVGGLDGGPCQVAVEHCVRSPVQNELAMLEFIHCFVEVLDKHFGQVRVEWRNAARACSSSQQMPAAGSQTRGTADVMPASSRRSVNLTS
jgi:hypothetical protein